jgi:hypothetical protein
LGLEKLVGGFINRLLGLNLGSCWVQAMERLRMRLAVFGFLLGVGLSAARAVFWEFLGCFVFLYFC